MKNKIFLLWAVLIFSFTVTSCKNGSEPKEEDWKGKDWIYQTWVLVEKNINDEKEMFPNDDKYPITLTFYPTKEFRGRCDANSYKGTFERVKFGYTISFSISSITDPVSNLWFSDYINELSQINRVSVLVFKEEIDLEPIKMELELYNEQRSVIFSFMDKKSFEETYFKLEKWYD